MNQTPESIQKAVETRKRNAILTEAENSDVPGIPVYCLCGCGATLPVKKHSQTRSWKQGHDATGKKLLNAVLRGDAKESTIPREMVIYRSRISFLDKIKEVNAAGENAAALLNRLAEKAKTATA